MQPKTETGVLSFSPREIILGALSLIIIITVLALLIEWVGVERLQNVIEEAGPLAPLIYISIKAATYVFAPLSSGPIQLVSGTLFGLVPGIIYTLIGEVLGGSISFWIARSFGRPVVVRFVGKEGLKRVDQFYDSFLGGWTALAYARLFLFAIYDFLSYAVGLSRLRFWTYVWVSTLFGAIPTAFFVGMGSFITGDRSMLVGAYVIVGVLSILPFIFRKQLQRLFPKKNEQSATSPHINEDESDKHNEIVG